MKVNILQRYVHCFGNPRMSNPYFIFSVYLFEVFRYKDPPCRSGHLQFGMSPMHFIKIIFYNRH